MKEKVFLGLLSAICIHGTLQAHCQMPCGIYHDQMIYDKIDEYFETMVKAISVMNDSKFENVHDKNQFMRWVITKENMSDEVAEVLTTYFLQQKIKPSKDKDADTDNLVRSIHKMLFLLVQIKQNADLKIVREFGAEWENFKVLFHPEDKCREAAPSTPPKATPDKSQSTTSSKAETNSK